MRTSTPWGPRAKRAGAARHPAQQCRYGSRRRRRRSPRHHRGGVRPHLAINLKGTVFACKHVIAIMREQRPARSSTSPRRRRSPPIRTSPTRRPRRRGGLHRAARLPERAIRHPRQRHPARTDNTPMAVDTRARESRRAAPRSRPSATPRCRCARRGHRLGRRQCRAVPRLGRGELHHRRDLPVEAASQHAAGIDAGRVKSRKGGHDSAQLRRTRRFAHPTAARPSW